jgi:putative toxin-antitoxin system antitoxin component (TIGR02293 family)
MRSKPSTQNSPACGMPGLENVLVWTPAGFRRAEPENGVSQVEGEKRFTGQSAGIQAKGTVEVLARLKKGLALSTFERLHKALAISSIELARVARISLRTLHRRRQSGRLLPEESERIFRIACVFDKAIDVLGDQEAARKWFKQPIRALGGKTPLEYCDMEPGLREVEDILGRIEHGVFS